jgi:hypothetical protein
MRTIGAEIFFTCSTIWFSRRSIRFFTLSRRGPTGPAVVLPSPVHNELNDGAEASETADQGDYLEGRVHWNFFDEVRLFFIRTPSSS